MDRSERRAQLILILLWCVAIVAPAYQLFSHSPQGGDFYPIYTGLRSVLSGISPYAKEVSDFLASSWRIASSHHVAPVVAYPLPALIPLLPLALFELLAAAKIWFAISVAALMAPLISRQSLKQNWLFAVSAFPVFHALSLGTSSVLWFGIAAAVVAGFKHLNAAVLGCLLALLPLKPQIGMVIAAYFLFCSWRKRRSVFVHAIFWTLLLLSISFIWYPRWLSEWSNVLATYSDRAVWISLLWPGLLLALLSIGLPALVGVAILQVCLFPINDLYSCLPLLIGWTAFRRDVVLLLSIITWLIPFVFDYANNSQALEYFVMIPLLIVLVLAQLGRLPRYSTLRGLLADETAAKEV